MTSVDEVKPAARRATGFTSSTLVIRRFPAP